MTTWTIRPAQAGDLSALIALEARFPTDRLGRASWRRFIRGPRAEVWVADGNGIVAGDAVLLYRHNSHRARLYSLVVDAAHTGQGIGRALLHACEQAARQRGCRELVLEVRPANAAAIGLYDSAGYRAIGQRAGFYEDGSTALILGKALAAAAATNRATAPALERAYA